MNAKREEYKQFISVLETVLDGAPAYYLAAPITSGKRLWELAARLSIADINAVRESHPDDFESEVLGPNVETAKSVAHELRKRWTPALVIDPSRLVVNTWSQEDYRTFWKEVIRRRVSKLFAAQGWQYSHGCVEECIEAFRRNIPICTFDGVPIDERTACKMIRASFREGLSAGFNVAFLEQALRVIGASQPCH